LTYLTNQILYLGSHLGDSQLLKISNTPISSEVVSSLAVPSEVKTVSLESLSYTSAKKGKARATSDDMDIDDDDDDHTHGRVVAPKGSFITVLETYKNIAPIMDAILVDTDKSGQNQIVTCSGGANTGSLNVIRTGTDFKELAIALDLAGVSKLWSVKAMINDS
jgi:DNA damage-binding protein 1